MSVTVIMPAYNCELYIETAIRSVINQTYTNWELIVIDDCSTDSTRDIVARLIEEDPRVTLIENSMNLGAAENRNKGVSLSKGDYVAFLDSDDIWYPEKLSIQLEKMDESGADISYTSYEIVDGDTNRVKSTYIVPNNISFESLLKENVIGCSSVVMTRELASKHPFRVDFYHEDYCLWLEILQAGYRIVGCTEVLTGWRFWSKSRSFNKNKSAVNRWKIYRENLGLPMMKSVRVFLAYALNGIHKYYG